MNLQEFKNAYMEEMKSSMVIGPLDPNEIERRVDKMILAVRTTAWNADWFNGNPCMKSAAKRFGYKTSKPFREAMKAL